MALVADRADALGLSHALGFGITNTVWAAGATVGPLLGGTLADATTDAVPYGLCALLCAATLLGVVRRAGPAPLFDRRTRA
jgi:MFS family permease